MKLFEAIKFFSYIVFLSSNITDNLAATGQEDKHWKVFLLWTVFIAVFFSTAAVKQLSPGCCQLFWLISVILMDGLESFEPVHLPPGIVINKTNSYFDLHEYGSNVVIINDSACYS